MRDAPRSTDPGQALAFQALLYAGGDLDGPEAVAFEERLGQDQAARDALCQAVELSAVLAGGSAPLPNPAYRRQVRARMAPPAGSWGWLMLRRPYRGHPLFWLTAGAAAALLGLQLTPTARGPAPVVAPPASVSIVAVEPEPTPDVIVEEAAVWAELNNNRHLSRAREEEARRRYRTEDRGRGGRSPDSRSRILGKPSDRD